MPPNLAKHLRRAAVLPLLLLLGASGSAVADQEVDQLRAENLRLKEQLQVMQRINAAKTKRAPKRPFCFAADEA